MDFDLIIFLLIFLFPLFQRLFGKKRQQPAKQPQPAKRARRARPELEATSAEQPEPQPARDPLSEALRQIREALAEQAEPERQQPEPQPRALAERPDEFREVGEFEHEAHGFGRENPLSEEVFERRPAFQTRTQARPERVAPKRIPQKPLGDVDLSTPLEVKTEGDASRRDLARRLRQPGSARDAFVLKEILDAPRSRRSMR
ncbi:MAG: hypothetical protein AAGI91_08105 [Bacteroidota bacterium]